MKVFEVMRKQEQTRLAELDAEKANFEAIQAHNDIVSGITFFVKRIESCSFPFEKKF